MYLLYILFLVNYVQTQQDLCTCSCCIGQSCIPTVVGTFYIPSCNGQTCLEQCRTSFAACQLGFPNGIVSTQCLSTPTNLYSCRCDCCNTGSSSCVPTFIGYSTAYTCQISSCSISCATQYPYQCIWNHNGQTNGICMGPLTTTTTTVSTTSIVSATNAPGSSNRCRCLCCQSGPNCSPNIDVGFATAFPCSSFTCTQACQNQYQLACPSLSTLGQTNGICSNPTTGNTVCQCQCCNTNGCPSYQINTNGDCSSCYNVCRSPSVCGNLNTVTYNCYLNQSQLSVEFSLCLTIIMSIIVLLNEYVSN